MICSGESFALLEGFLGIPQGLISKKVKRVFFSFMGSKMIDISDDNDVIFFDQIDVVIRWKTFENSKHVSFTNHFVFIDV